ncbi:hypothetical protein OUZ56_005452 [Daphnia magna]|uniref:Uncharacterized protein n=1 Tax=Daphnia magna TaxID=35525 RepID=A0ABQ9YST9_9CRUS|nr:hypothetical protein OUZ56_005452 [Daphnia magna]
MRDAYLSFRLLSTWLLSKASQPFDSFIPPYPAKVVRAWQVVFAVAMIFLFYHSQALTNPSV